MISKESQLIIYGVSDGDGYKHMLFYPVIVNNGVKPFL